MSILAIALIGFAGLFIIFAGLGLCMLVIAGQCDDRIDAED